MAVPARLLRHPRSGLDALKRFREERVELLEPSRLRAELEQHLLRGGVDVHGRRHAIAPIPESVSGSGRVSVTSSTRSAYVVRARSRASSSVSGASSSSSMSPAE
jgi:hypothetical protein